MNQNKFEPNPCYDYNSFGFDQPLQYTIDHQEDLNQQSIKDVDDRWNKMIESQNKIMQIFGETSSVEDLIPIPSEFEDTPGSDSECILPSCDDFSPIDIPKEKAMTFSNPLFNSNNDFISSDDESLSDEDVPKDNVKIYLNPIFEFDDKYISSDVNSLFDKVLEDIECKDSYDPNLDESTFLVTPLSDSNEDEYFTPSDDVELLLHHDPSIPKISVASILESFLSVLDQNKSSRVAHTLLDLNTPKKKSAADQYILQKRTPKTVEPTGPSLQPEDERITMTNSETDSDKIVTPVKKEKDACNRELTEINVGVQDEGHGGSNLGKQDEGQAGSNPEFTTTAYPNVKENLKLPTEDHMILEEPASSTGTLSSLQNLEKELSFTDQFFVEKPQKEEPEKTNTESEVPSMVTVPIHQDTSSVPPMTTPVHLSNDEVTKNDHLPKADMRKDWWKPLLEEERPTTPKLAWTIPSSNVKDLDLLRYGNKGSSHALLISNMKAAQYPDFGLELLVLEQMWIDKVCTYDISAAYGWDAKGFKFKHDYTIIESPQAVVFSVNNNEQKIMRFNEMCKFSDGTLTHILEALDYRVKEYRVNRLNPGMNIRFWTDKDVTRSKEFIHAIEQRLKTIRIFQNLECFMEMEIPRSSGVYFITACSYSTDTSKELMKIQVNKNDDAQEHVEWILDIVNLFNILGVTHDVVMLCVFPITLTRVAKRWVDRLSLGTVDSWDLLKKAFIQRYWPPSKTTKQLEEICNFKQEGDETLYQE
uniref:Retrotransposon gag domain-containing protein n=1 Tax=Tanacetum cinerariifolium TaxID=118510 RepID=A0A6L2NU22_TANCI|nr:hypothetical protein [Tanacetum cinerariifolium]